MAASNEGDSQKVAWFMQAGSNKGAVAAISSYQRTITNIKDKKDRPVWYKDNKPAAPENDNQEQLLNV